jgi:hypothetical protein
MRNPHFTSLVSDANYIGYNLPQGNISERPESPHDILMKKPHPMKKGNPDVSVTVHQAESKQ